MKKLICIVLTLLLLLGCLTACNFTQNMSGAIAGEAEATPKVKDMMLALAEGRTDDAKAFMHPQVVESSDTAIDQMSTFLASRKSRSTELKNISVNTSTGTAGKIRQEQVIYKVSLADGSVIYVNAVYLSNSQGTGFASFQIVLGVI